MVSRSTGGGRAWSLTLTADEMSLVCEVGLVPGKALQVEAGWLAFKLRGPFPFDQTGVLLSVLRPLAEAKVGILALSTFDTDIVLIKRDHRATAITVLTEAGHTLRCCDALI